ncbi:MAG: hypothetical protein ABIP95_00780 [Pelobium sp.]
MIEGNAADLLALPPNPLWPSLLCGSAKPFHLLVIARNEAISIYEVMSLINKFTFLPFRTSSPALWQSKPSHFLLDEKVTKQSLPAGRQQGIAPVVA